MTATGAAPLWSSEGSRRRPAQALRPKVWKALPETNSPPSGSRGMIAADAANAEGGAAGLEGGEILEAGSVVAELAILLGGEERPVVLHAAVDAAVLVVADADELAGLHHRQRLEQHGMDEGEDGSGGADAESQRKDGGDGKAGRLEELAQRVANVFQHEGRRALRG